MLKISTKSDSVASNIASYSVAMALLFQLGFSVGCAPKDEKVSTKPTGFAASGTTDGAFSDHVTEYSRSMLIELADVARQAEFTLQAVALRDAPVPEVLGAPAPTAIRTSACKTVTSVPSPEGRLKLQTEIQACKEKGVSFEGTQFGREVSYAEFTKAPGARTFATFISTESDGVDTVLKPVANLKDTLRVKSSRFFEANFIAEENGTRLYRFAFKNFSTYELDLKAMTDVGSITSTVSGVLVYDIAANRVTAFRAVEDRDRMKLKVESARMGRPNGKIVRQEFYGSGVAQQLAIDLGACALPVGEMRSRFTVRPLVGDKKYLIDSSTVVVSLEDNVVDLQKPVGGSAPAKLCTADEQITMTEFYAGLLY